MKGNLNSKKGAILVFVLGLVVLLGSLCLRLMEETVKELKLVSQYHKRDDLRLQAYSLLDVTVAVLNEFHILDNQPFKKGDMWEQPIEWSGGLPTLEERVEWSVSFRGKEGEGESGKLPLFKTNEKAMKEIFAVMHSGDSGLLDEEDGKPYYDAWMDWQDADENTREEGAEDDYYDGLIPPYFTPGKNVESFEEFRMIKGFGADPDNFKKSGLFFDNLGNETINFKNFRDSFSFYHKGAVNIFGASDFLLKYICGDDEALYRDIKSGVLTPQHPPIPINSLIPISWGIVETFMVDIAVTKGRARFELHAVLTFDQGKANTRTPEKQKARSKQNQKLKYPARILRLRENENLID
jgi:hypothetical protein